MNAQIVHQIHYSLLLWLKCPQEITTYAGLKNEVWFDDSLRLQSVLPTQGISLDILHIMHFFPFRIGNTARKIKNWHSYNTDCTGTVWKLRNFSLTHIPHEK